MAVAFVVIAAGLTVAAVVWFLFGRSSERTSARTESTPERSHFAPGDAGTEDQASARPGETGPRG